MAWHALELIGNHLWQSTLFLAVVALLALAFRRNGARVRYGLWLAASVKFLVPFAVLVALGGQVAWRSPLPQVQPELLTVVETIGQPFTSTESGAVTLPASAAASSDRSRVLSVALLAIWACGLAAILLTWAVRWRRVESAVRRGSPLTEGREVEAMRRVARHHAMRALPIVSSEGPLEPGVFGIVRPVLLWPRDLSAHLTDEQVETILAHELAHVGRHDNLAAALHMAVQAVFWFHPLVWWIGARLADERERACDELVVRSGRDPAVYAESILQTCRLSLASPLPCVAGVTGANLKTRIEAIMRHEMTRALNGWRKVLLVTAGIVAVAAPVAVGILNAPPARAQSPQADFEVIRGAREDLADVAGVSQDRTPEADRPAFEVASVKVNRSGDPRVRIMGQGGRFTAENVQARVLIRNAYRLQDFQLVGGPDWLDSERFNIDAKIPDELVLGGSTNLMLQSLLEERFNLVVHSETREMPIYALVLARDDGRLGPRLKPAEVDCEAMRAAGAAPLVAQPSARGGGAPGGGNVVVGRAGPGGPPQGFSAGQRPPCSMFFGPDRLISGGVPMSGLASSLSGRLNRVVQDRTGLAGNYEFELEFAPDQFQGAGPLGSLPGQPPPAPPPVPSDAPSLFTALQEQLGLRLESQQRGPVEVLVIDSIERPTED